MASSEIEKAKTLLTLALFRPDPTPCPPKEIETIAALLQTATNKCSPANVQNCKKWALANLVSSERRVEPFCNYLVALANSFRAEDVSHSKGSSKPATAQEARVSSAARRRLHILYILSDIMYHVKYRLQPPEHVQKSFTGKLEPSLPLLVKSASSFVRRPKQIEKIRGLISIWGERGYFPSAYLDTLRKAVDDGLAKGGKGDPDTTAQDNASSAASGPKPVPFNMPKRHGDLSTAWYDLPPGNWLRWIDGTYPLDPQKIAPIEFKPGPAREELVEAVTKVLADVKRIYAKEAEPGDQPVDISEMGERLERGKHGEITGGDTYYGWSRQFCRKIKDKEQHRFSRGRAPERSHSSSRSVSRSTSQAAHGRYRHRDGSSASTGRPGFNRHRSGSNASSRSDRSNRRRSRSPGYSRSTSRGSDYRGARDYKAPESRPRGGLGSGYHAHRGGSRSQSGGYDRSRSPSTQNFSQVPNTTGFMPHQPGANMFPQQNMQPHFQHNPQMPFPMPHMFPQGPPPVFPQQGYGNFSVPPPPPHFQGQWPPLPPPPPSMPGKQNWGRGGGYNGMGRGRGGYQRGGRW